MIFDTNVVLDLLDAEPGSPTLALLERQKHAGRLVINEIIFAEISSRFREFALAREACQTFGLAIEHLKLEECHRAGQAFAEYRRRGGIRETILPDFLIGAQAELRGWPLVTRDRKGFVSYFPNLEIIDPTDQ